MRKCLHLSTSCRGTVLKVWAVGHRQHIARNLVRQNKGLPRLPEPETLELEVAFHVTLVYIESENHCSNHPLNPPPHPDLSSIL
jgi:hypothetical protein